MAWETRPWSLKPNPEVVRDARRNLNKRVRVTLDPRSWDAEDANDLRVEGTVLAISQDGPTLFLENPSFRTAAIDVLVIEPLENE